MRHVLGSIVLASMVFGGTLMLGESAASAQAYYGPAYGPPAPPPQRGYYATPRPYYYGHTHDGFFVRLTAGFGYLNASVNDVGVTDTYSGVGGTLGAAFGGTIAPNLVLFGEFMSTYVSDPDFQPGGEAAFGFSGEMTLYGFGPGVAYYFEPINLYLSSTLAFSALSISDYDQNWTRETNLGLGLTFAVGKEWWVTRDWGIGVAGQLHLASMRDDYYNSRFSASAFSLLFSATYN